MLPSNVEWSTYQADNIDRIMTSPRWREQIFWIENDPAGIQPKPARLSLFPYEWLLPRQRRDAVTQMTECTRLQQVNWPTIHLASERSVSSAHTASSRRVASVSGCSSPSTRSYIDKSATS